jgi:GNAT superfamily N-acetyltransferase
MNDFTISTDTKKLQLEVIYNFLKNSYWAKDIEFSILKKSIDNSFNFGIYYFEKQIGYARVVTDFSRFAYIADVFILEDYRKKGLSKLLMKTILECPKLSGIKSWILKTHDAQGLYKQFGFTNPAIPERIMEFSGFIDAQNK